MYSIWTALGFRGNPYDQANLPGSEEGAELFCGRSRELLRVQVGIASGGSHVSIEGDAGVGKTSLAQVASYDMFRQAQAQRDGTLFIPVPAPIQLGRDAADFERIVWRSVANALIENEETIRSVGLDAPDLGGLGTWLNSPTLLTTGSLSVMGFGAAGGRGMNTSSGFAESGFNSFVRRQLARVFPDSASGGVVCILDNLELLGTSEVARHALETIRAALLEVPSLRWVFVGSKGIVTSARSARLSGFIDLPLRLMPLTIDEGVELVGRRLAYWGTERAHAPVQAEDFRYLYRTLGLNLRDSLAIAQQFAKDYYTDFVGTQRDLPSDNERPLYFQSWLTDKADSFLSEVSGVPDETWKLLDRLCADGGRVRVDLADHDSMARLIPLKNAQLLDLETDPTQASMQIGTVTAHGWLCASARPRAAFMQAGGTGALPGLSQTRSDDDPLGALGRPRTVSEIDDSALPKSCRLTEVLGIEPLDAESVIRRWSSGPSSTRAVIGLTSDGPFTVDLRSDGPHGLVAGTTGSGKSELLQSIVASLAVANRPDAMTFVLVDYKGGSAFHDCVLLPHTVGMVTDLDAHLTERALSSLSAELHRREQHLAKSGSRHIEDYHELQARDSRLAPLPRLLIVVDEFASMAREVPDMVTGLVSIARRGRSLGVHLLLATQRPSGVVSPEIRANTNLRIAMRVIDAADSTDVLNAPDAARISRSTPGRAFARLGDGPLVPFQAARVGGQRSGHPTVPPDGLPSSVSDGATTDQTLLQPSTPADGESTDLAFLVRAVTDAAERLQIMPPPSPWLPPLPLVVLVDALTENYRSRPGADDSATTKRLGAPDSIDSTLTAIPYGLEDLPNKQAQRPAELDLSRAGHVFAVGAARSGRSQLLRTIAGSAAALNSCADVHIYAIDCGDGALLALAELPHCGAVVTRAQTERAPRLLARLTAEVARRRALLSDAGFADITEQRVGSDRPIRLPHVLLLLDRWEAFTSTLGELDGGRLTDAVIEILREGPSVGVHVIATGDRSLLSGRVGSLTEDKLAFRMKERGDYALVGLNPRQMPEEIPIGRCYRAESGEEVQVALLSTDTSGQGQATAIARIAVGARERDAAVPPPRRPFRVDALPTRLTFQKAWEMRPKSTGPLFGLVGVGGDELVAVGPELDRMPPSFIVAGPPKSGRSTALLAMAKSFLASGAMLVAATPRSSPLREIDGCAGVLGVVRTATLTTDELHELLAKAGDAPVAVVLDDAEIYKDCDAAELLRALVRGTAGPQRAIVLGGSAEKVGTGLAGWQAEARNARQGALLSPQGAADGDLIGVRIPRGSVGAPMQPGRALLHLGDGHLLTVQVPV